MWNHKKTISSTVKSNDFCEGKWEVADHMQSLSFSLHSHPILCSNIRASNCQLRHQNLSIYKTKSLNQARPTSRAVLPQCGYSEVMKGQRTEPETDSQLTRQCKSFLHSHTPTTPSKGILLKSSKYSQEGYKWIAQEIYLNSTFIQTFWKV